MMVYISKMFNFNLCTFLVLVANFICSSYAHKLLLVFSFPSRSHSILGEGFVRHLHKDGHEITFITSFPMKNPPSNLRQIVVSSTFDAFPDVTTIWSISRDIGRCVTTVCYGDRRERSMSSSGSQQADILIFGKKYSYVFEISVADFSISNVVNKIGGETYFDVMKIMMNVSKAVVLDSNVQNMLLDKNQHFDAIIAEWMFSELFSGLSSVFGCPLIWSSSMEPHWQVAQLIDEPTNPSYTCDILSAISVPFSFTERLQQLWIQLQVGYIRKFHIGPEEHATYIQAYKQAAETRGRALEPYDEVRYNGSLLFGNSHASFGNIMSLPESYKPIGGYHVDKEVKPLPKYLQEIMNNASHGVIYFSMGSVVKSKDMPEQMKIDLLRTLGELKQKILWKFEEDLPNVPENVHIMKWAPQQSILAHPKTILFLTHGGLLSTIEAIHYGVPIIGMPVFADQHLVVLRAVTQGFAVKVGLSYNLATDLKQAINEMLTNSKYREKAHELSMIYHDRLSSPGTEIRHWVRHVIITGGASHLRSPALLVPFYQKYYLDLLVLIVILVFIVAVLVRKLVVMWSQCKKYGTVNFKKID